MSTPWRTELGATLRLAAPLVAAFAGNQLLSLVDTIIAGRLGAVEIAAVGVGGAIAFMAFIVPMGLLMGLDPIAAQAVGVGRLEVARRALRETLVLAALLGPIAVVVPLLAAGPVLGVVDLEPAAADGVWRYLFGRAPSAVPYLVVVAQRSYLQANGRVRAVFVSTLVANVVNLPLSFGLALGDGALTAVGLPAIGLGTGLGELGIGLASSIVSLAQALVLIGPVRRIVTPAVGPISRAGVAAVIRVGWPIGTAFLLEAGMFSMVSVLAADFGTLAAGSHQVALQLASFTFTVCLGISAATSVRVGQAVGRGDRVGTRRAGSVGLGAGVAFMACTATAFALFPATLGSWVARDPAVVAAAIPLLQVAAGFQLFDGLQAVAAGALRGAGDTRATLGWAALGHWGVGLGVGAGLAWGAGLGVLGLWWGLTAGLGVMALALTRRFLSLAGRVRPMGVAHPLAGGGAAATLPPPD